MFGLIAKLGEAVLKQTGIIGKGKMTAVGAVATVAGLTASGATGGDPFESAKILIGLIQQGWPHVLIVGGGLTTVAGFFRKAGARAAQGE